MYSNWAFQRTHYWTPKIQDGWDPPFWKSTWRHFSAEGGPIWIKFRRLVQNDISTAMTWSWSKSKPDVEFQYDGRLGELNGKPSQSHLPHCMVLPPGEFNVMLPDRVGKCHDIFESITISKISKISRYFLIFSILSIFSRKWKFRIRCNMLMQYLMTTSYQPLLRRHSR